MNDLSIILAGKPGSGKDSQGNILSQNLPRLNHIVSSQLIDEWKATGSPSALAYESERAKGKLLTDDLMIKVFDEGIDRRVKNGIYAPGKDILLLNGYPRTLDQAKARKLRVLDVLYLDVDDKICVERILSDAKRTNRKDNNEQVILERIATFKKLTYPILGYYQSIGVPVHSFDGNVTKHHLALDIIGHLQSFLPNYFPTSAVNRR